jgi:hypothetical protein
LKLERLKKFGAVLPESKEDLERRKQKFGLVGPILPTEDPETIQKRLAKFGGN